MFISIQSTLAPKVRYCRYSRLYRSELPYPFIGRFYCRSKLESPVKAHDLSSCVSSTCHQNLRSRPESPFSASGMNDMTDIKSAPVEKPKSPEDLTKLILFWKSRGPSFGLNFHLLCGYRTKDANIRAHC